VTFPFFVMNTSFSGGAFSCARTPSPTKAMASKPFTKVRITKNVASLGNWRGACIIHGMNMLKRCIGYLKRNGIQYSHSVHPPAYTAREAASADRMAYQRCGFSRAGESAGRFFRGQGGGQYSLEECPHLHGAKHQL
jgi:hypothetical protein